ncbi:MAG TPA: hypothetical protein VMU55_09330, partial [Solirubrobacteraceae bacterium]|nr:hypothetical protein [Solirubrobacteraceae bacterium]
MAVPVSGVGTVCDHWSAVGGSASEEESACGSAGSSALITRAAHSLTATTVASASVRSRGGRLEGVGVAELDSPRSQRDCGLQLWGQVQSGVLDQAAQIV